MAILLGRVGHIQQIHKTTHKEDHGSNSSHSSDSTGLHGHCENAIISIIQDPRVSELHTSSKSSENAVGLGDTSLVSPLGSDVPLEMPFGSK